MNCWQYITYLLENPIIAGIFSSLCFAGLLYGFQSYRYHKHLRKKFNGQIYQTFHKTFPSTPIQEIRLNVKRNIIHFNGKRITNGTEFSGQLIVNPINLKIAEGYHNHHGDDGFGFLKMIITDNDQLFVEAPFTTHEKIINDKGVEEIVWTRKYQAFVWKRKL